MHPEDIQLSEMSDRKRKILYDFTDIWNLKNKQKKCTNKTETDIENWCLPEVQS